MVEVDEALLLSGERLLADAAEHALSLGNSREDRDVLRRRLRACLLRALVGLFLGSLDRL